VEFDAKARGHQQG
jgi:hypothetical protein